MFQHADSMTDPLANVLRMAKHQRVVLPDLRESLAFQAGTLATPPRDSGILSDQDAYVIDAVLRQFDWLSHYEIEDVCSRYQGCRRVQLVAAVAAHLLPPVVWDYEGRYSVTISDDGFLPFLQDVERTLHAHVARLREYLMDHDAGAWVDPNAVAGEVANVHDAARMLCVLLEVS